MRSLSALLVSLLLASSACGDDVQSNAGGAGGNGGDATTGDGGAGAPGEGGGGGFEPPPAPAADCPPVPIPSCTTATESTYQLWLDPSAELGTPARVVDIEQNAVLVQTEPVQGTGEPLLLIKNFQAMTLPVSAPHEPVLRGITLAHGNIVLCGDTSCRVYGQVENGLRALDAPEVPMAEDAIAGSFAIGDYWSSPTAPVSFCVFGDGVVCLENGEWSELGPAGDALLASGSNSPVEHVVTGENGRMGKLSRWPDTEAPPVWTELEPLTDAALRAAGSWYAAGDDGTFITLGTTEATLCGTGDQDWYMQAGRLFSTGGDVLFFSDPEVAMSGPCMRTGPSLGLVASTDYTDGTTWGIALATQTQVFRRATGATE